jgi:hypothetical protein
VSTTTPETTISEADRYLKEVAPYLAAVPADERADLLEDLAQHLREIAAEPGAPLAQRLGSPEAYAAELLASAGVAAAADGRRPALRSRSAALVTKGRESRVGREVTKLWPVLRPAWWVARAYLAVSLVVLLTKGGNPGFPLPHLFGSPFVGLIAIVLCIPLSVRLGERTFTGAGRWAAIGANGALMIVALVLLVKAGNRQVSYVQVGGAQAVGNGTCLTNSGGQPITNLYAYGPDGNLLNPVLLYDQNGQPINNLCPDVDSQGRPLVTQYGRDVNGAPVINAFPRTQSVVLQPESPFTPGQPATTAPVNPPAVVVPRLAPTPSTTTTVPTGVSGSPSASTSTSSPPVATTAPPG